jgi:selenide,water dikinase
VGDKLILTKALGTGVISTAIKRGKAEPAWIDAASRSMTTLNRAAADVVRESYAGVHSMTDITGFGLIGHAREMALGSAVGLRIHSAAVPLLAGALECVRAGFVPGGLKANRDFAECQVGYADNVPEERRTILFDPQTAGGLLISVAAGDSKGLAGKLRAQGAAAEEIGEVTAQGKPLIRVD